LYPKINIELAELLTESKFSTKEIDREFLIFLIEFGYNLEEMAKKYNLTYDVFRKWLKKVLGMNFTDAKAEYYWKPRIISEIRMHDQTPAVLNIANLLGMSVSAIIKAIKRIWKYEFEILGKIKAVLEHVKKNQVS
jgi:hypothetical protein